MGVDDGAEFRGRRRGRARVSAATTGGTARITRIVLRDRHLVLAEIEGRDFVVRQNRAPRNRWPNATFTLRRVEKAQRRLDEGGAQAVAGDQRPAGLAARGQRLADDGAGERGARLLRLGVERREPERPRETLVERPRAWHDLADRSFVGGAQAAGQTTNSRAPSCPARGVSSRKSTRAGARH